MTRPVFVAKMLLLVGVSTGPVLLYGQQNPEKRFYDLSLHSTNRGLAHWYAKENGGLERITGIPFEQLPSCNQCHVSSCDTCHADGGTGRRAYSTAKARTETACDKCHDLESRTYASKNPGAPGADVHFARGMKCMHCHSAREVHGDGVPYTSMQAPGAMDARCEKCHDAPAKCPSNAVHRGKLDCNACHARNVDSCYNCHFDTKVNAGKSVSLPLKNTLFLINHDGKVTTANLHTFIYRNRTLIVFAPAFSHWITRQGRQCDACHDTNVVRQMRSGSLKLVTWDGAELKTPGGIVPVFEGYKWDFPFLNYEDGRWASATGAMPPLMNYSGYSTPISAAQLANMAKQQSPQAPPAKP